MAYNGSRYSHYLATLCLIIVVASTSVILASPDDEPLSISSQPEAAFGGWTQSVLSENQNSVLGESQPADFQLFVDYKPRGESIDNIEAMVTIVRCLVSLSFKEWNEQLSKFRYSDFEPNPMLDILLTSNRAQGQSGFHTKTMMWSLRIISCYFFTHNRYAEISYSAEYRDKPNLGYGQLIKRKPTQGEASQLTESAPNELSLLNASIPVGLSITVTSLVVEPTEPVFTPYEVFSLMMNIVILMAELRPEKVNEGSSAYYPPADFSLSFTPKGNKQKFINRAVILSIAYLARILPTVQSGKDMWRECKWDIRSDGRVVGEGKFMKGRPPPAEFVDGNQASVLVS